MFSLDARPPEIVSDCERVEENIVTSAWFRTPASIQPPRGAHLGFRIEF
jgi:hypothetical protein